MQSPRRTGAYLALIMTCAAAGAQGSQNPQATLRTLVTAREAHSLPSQQAARAFPVHLHAVVTYYDPYIDSRHGALFVHDSSGSIFVSVPARPILSLQAGTVVDVVGVTGAGDYAPIVDRAQVQAVGQSQVPREAIKAMVAQLFSGSLDGQWVELDGLVHSVHLEPENVILNIATIGGPVTAVTRRESEAKYESLVDCLIRIHANAAPVFNRKRQMVGVHLFFPSLDVIKVLRGAPPDPFALPAIPISGLLSFSPGAQLGHRVHVQGTVTLHWPGRTLCIQQQNGILCMQTGQGARAEPGDLVDVIGFPAIGDYKPTLENAAFRVFGHGAAPPAAPITAAQAFRGDRDGELVRIEGELVGQDRATGDVTLMLRSGKFLVPAILPKELAGSGPAPWKDGSILSLTGICSVLIDPETTRLGEGEVRSGSVQLLLRSVDDVAVVSAPSWWTPRHALAVLAIVATLALAALAWVLVLRRRVEQQTRALRTSEERLRHLSEHDALTNLPNRVLLSDRLGMAIERAESSGRSLGLLMVDVDRFKEVNDAFGHHVGDRVLYELARRLSHAVRLTDTVARIGGDEFIVLLPDLRNPAEAQSIAAKILAFVSQPFGIGTVLVPLTVSVGVCTYPEAGTGAAKLLQNADAAMYGVKSHGRNGFQVYRPEGIADAR